MFDIDEQIEVRYGLSVGKIFEQEGEEYFRSIEKSILKETFEMENVIVSCGGGTPCDAENLNSMKFFGYCIYLKRDIDYILNIFSSPVEILKRPKLKNIRKEKLKEVLEELLIKRGIFYEKAHKTICDNKDMENFLFKK